jgi:hypothetical protein
VGGDTGEDVPPESFPSLTYELTLVPNAKALSGGLCFCHGSTLEFGAYDGTNDAVLHVKGVEGSRCGFLRARSSRSGMGPR